MRNLTSAIWDLKECRGNNIHSTLIPYQKCKHHPSSHSEVSSENNEQVSVIKNKHYLICTCACVWMLKISCNCKYVLQEAYYFTSTTITLLFRSTRWICPAPHSLNCMQLKVNERTTYHMHQEGDGGAGLIHPGDLNTVRVNASHATL